MYRYRWELLILLCMVLMLGTMPGCAFTEKQLYGYQSAELILRAGELEGEVSAAAYKPVAEALRKYSKALDDGDRAGMRRALDELHAAEVAIGRGR